MSASRRRRRSAPRLSARDLQVLADGLATWGALFTKMGEVEKLIEEAGDFTRLMSKLQRLGTLEFQAIIESNPNLMVRLQAFYEEFERVASETGDKEFWDLSADEQIELGLSCNHLSRVISEIVESIE